MYNPLLESRKQTENMRKTLDAYQLNTYFKKKQKKSIPKNF